MNSTYGLTVLMKILMMSVCLTTGFSHVVANHPTGSLSGRILDGERQSPLTGAVIRIPALNRFAISDQLGLFNLPEIPVGEYEVSITFLGYSPHVEQVQVQARSRTLLQVELQPKPIEVSEISIVSEQLSGRQFAPIQSLDIELRPVQSSQDVLRAVPGLFIAQHAGGGKAEQIFLRGFDIDHGTDIEITVDGLPVNMVSHAHGQGYADLHFLIPETIEQISWGKGPYESDAGNFATAGYAHFRTQRAPAESQVSLEVGQYDTWRAMGIFNLLENQRDHHAYIATEYIASDGYFDASQDFQRINFFGKYTGLLSQNTLLEASASNFWSEWDASGQIPFRAVEQGLISRFGAIDSTEGGKTTRSNLNVSLTRSLGNGATLFNQFYYTHYTFDLFSNFTFFLEDAERGDQIRQEESRHLYGWQSKYQRSGYWGNMAVRTEAGASIRLDRVDEVSLSKTQNRSELLERLAYGDVNELNAALFARQQFWPMDWLMVEAGLRYDRFSFRYEDRLTPAYDPAQRQKGLLSPKLKTHVKISEALRLYVHGGMGLHSNDTRSIVAGRVDRMLPRAYGTDIGAFIKPVPGLLIQTAIWGLWLDQEFVYVGDAGIVEPGSATRRMGADLSIRYQVLPWLLADADFTYSHAQSLQVPESERFIPLAPRFTGTGGISIRHDRKISGSLRYRYLADRPANETNSLTADGYLLMDAILRYRHKDMEIGVSVENLLGTDWEEAQFETESRLPFESEPVTEIHFTPGAPFFARLRFSYFF